MFEKNIYKIKSEYRWLLRKRLRDDKLLFTRRNIFIDFDGIEYYRYFVRVNITAQFNAEKKFGLKLGEQEGVSVYAYIEPDTSDVMVTYEIYYADGLIDSERQFTALTQQEKNLILTLANEASMKETGWSVRTHWRIFTDYEEDTGKAA